MTTVTSSPRLLLFGLTAANPLAWVVAAGAVGSSTAFIAALVLSLGAASAEMRYWAGGGLAAIIIIAPIVLTLLLIAARVFQRTISVRSGDYVARWPLPEGGEVFISRHGLCRTTQPWRLDGFHTGLLTVEVQDGHLVFHYLFLRIRRYRVTRHLREHRVRIPPGYQAEAERVAEHMRSQAHPEDTLQSDQWRFGMWMAGIALGGLLLLTPFMMSLSDQRIRADFDARATAYLSARSTDAVLLSAALPTIRAILDPQAQQLLALPPQTIPAAALSFRPSDGVREVIIGRCLPDEMPYLMVLLERPPRDPFMAPYGAYIYTALDPENNYRCAPLYWDITEVQAVAGKWWWVSVSDARATAIPLATQWMATFQAMTPTPPAR